MFEVFLTLDGIADVFVSLGIDQPIQSLSFREAFRDTFAVFPNSPRKIVGHAHIKRAVRSVRHDVNPSTWHGHIVTSTVGVGNRRRGWPGQAHGCPV